MTDERRLIHGINNTTLKIVSCPYHY
ncbi:hypothetical protein [Candidatus Williamhamiltonella defendens]|nr:hypothetical protein [Candidatus Hamiltonella defensa]